MPNYMQYPLTPTEASYLKEVYELVKDGTPVPPIALSRAFGVSRVSSMEMLRKLEAKGYGEYWPRRGLALNESGKRTAEALIRKHRLFECLIFEKLGVPRADVCCEAGQVDRFLSDSLATRMEDALGHPDTCPCGKPISTSPARKGA